MQLHQLFPRQLLRITLQQLFIISIMGSTPTSIHPQPMLLKANTQYESPSKPKEQAQSTHTPHQHLKHSQSISEYPLKSEALYDTMQVKQYSALKTTQPTTSFQKQQDYQQLFLNCNKDIDKYFKVLEEKISEVYLNLAKEALDGMNKKQLINFQGKIFISEKILKNNLNILKIIGRQTNHVFNEGTFEKFNKLQVNLTQYLNIKYPRSAQNFVPGDLMKVFKEFTMIEKLENDMLKNSQTYFRSDNEQEIVRDIKIFFNKVIEELDLKFPKFQKIMQEKVFQIQGENGLKTVYYKIGRKIPENIAKFTDLSSKNLDINSPEMFRVIIKWVQDMEKYLQNPQEMEQKQSLKMISYMDGKVFFDEINVDENINSIQNELIPKLEQEKEAYKEELANLNKELYLFNHNLIRIFEQGDRKEKYILSHQAELIKFAKYNTKCLEWMVAEKLMIVLKKLIKVGRSFINSTLMMPLDLIKFNVTDLMRGLVTGSKKQILAVYENLKKLADLGEIKIIKIKNRLASPLNDAMIIFMIKESYLICELQLILSDGLQNTSDKIKNTETLNHFFYELYRSPYGVLSELAVLLGYKDSRISFADQIHYSNVSEAQFQLCEKDHPKQIKSIDDQLDPFICTKCCKFYSRLQNLFIMKECSQCNKYLCNFCIFEQNPNMFEAIRKNQLTSYIERELQKFSESIRNKKEAQSLIKANQILQKLSTDITYLKDLPKSSKNQISINNFEIFLLNQNFSQEYIILVQFIKSQVTLSSIYMNKDKKQLELCFDDEDFYKKKSLKFSNYDYLINFKSDVLINQISSDQKQKFEKVHHRVNIFNRKKQDLEKGVFKGLEIGNTFLIVNSYQKKVKKENENNFAIDSNKKEFKYNSIGDYIAHLPDLLDAKRSLNLSNLGLLNKHMTYFQTIDWKNHIKELRISKNCIADLKPVLQNLVNLQKLYASENYLENLTFAKKLPSLSIAIISKNRIASIKGLQYVMMLNRLDLESNLLQEFPICKLKELRFLILSSNNLKSLDFFIKSQLDNIMQIILISAMSSDVEIETMQFSHKNLTVLQINGFKINQISILSKKLENLDLASMGVTKIVMASTKIRNLNLQYNALSTVNEIFETEMVNLEKIILTGNAITQFPKMNCKNIESIDLSSNPLTSIANIQFSRIAKLKELNISYTSVKRFVEMNFAFLEKLTIDGIVFTNLEELQKSNLPRIKDLTFTINQLEHPFPKISFQRLETLNLYFINKTLDQFAESQLPNLTTLSIQQGTIEKIPAFKFKKLTSLQISYAQVQDFSKLGDMDLPLLESLYMYDLSNCPTETYVNEKGQWAEKQSQVPSNGVLSKLNLPSLKELTFSQVTAIKSIDGLTTSNLPKLQSLIISCCQLEHIPKMNFGNLKSIEMSSNLVTNFSDFFDSSLPNLESLTLDSNPFTVLNNIKQLTNDVNIVENNIKFTSLKKLSISYSQIKDLAITNLPNLETLYMSSLTSMYSFPQLSCPNLTDLNIDGNPFKSLNQLSLCSLPQLNSFSISYGIDPTTFEDKSLPALKIPKAKVIYFSNLTFEEVSALQISQIEAVEDLNLSFNKITNFPIVKIMNLRILRLNNNNLTRIDCLAKMNLERLQQLSLESNQLEEFPIINAPNLVSLNLTENKLTNCQAITNSTILKPFILTLSENPHFHEKDSFHQNISSLYLNKAAQTSLQPIGKLRKLEKLYLDLNELTKIAETFSFRSLVEISLTQNKIQDISFMFEGKEFSALSYLILSNNLLKKFTKINAPALVSVSIDNNLIQNLDEFLNLKLPSLAYVQLHTNKLRKVTNYQYISTATASDINFSNNELETCEFLSSLKEDCYAYNVQLQNNKLKAMIPFALSYCYTLDLSHNQIASMSWLETSKLPYLQTLRMSNNLLKKIEKIPDHLVSLYYLHLQNNAISDYQEFLKTTGCSGLSVMSLTWEEEQIDLVENTMKAIFPNIVITFYDKNEAVIEKKILQAEEPVQAAQQADVPQQADKQQTQLHW